MWMCNVAVTCSEVSLVAVVVVVVRSIRLSVGLLSTYRLETEAILPDFLTFLDLTTSKTQQVCETSLFFELDNV